MFLVEEEEDDIDDKDLVFFFEDFSFLSFFGLELYLSRYDIINGEWNEQGLWFRKLYLKGWSGLFMVFELTNAREGAEK